MDRLKSAISEGVMTSTASLKRRASILSRPAALFGFNCFMAFVTKVSDIVSIEKILSTRDMLASCQC